MAVSTNEVVLILDMCLFLRKQPQEYWDLFIDYYLRELRSVGFDLMLDKNRLKSVVRCRDFEKSNILKQLTFMFGQTHRQYYDFYLNNNTVIVRLADEIKKQRFINDCEESRLCDVWGVQDNIDEFNYSVKDLQSKGYSSDRTKKLFAVLTEEKQKSELNRKKKTLMDGKPQELNEMQIKLYKFFERCDVVFRDEVISDESIIQALESYYVNLIGSPDHVTAITLHTGSICFQVIGILVITLLCILSNEWDNAGIISAIKQGDSVLYGGKKYVYSGIQEIAMDPKKPKITEKCFVLQQGEFNKLRLPCSKKPLIYPYKGSAVTNKGFKSDNKERVAFLKDSMDYNENEITGVISSSAVIVMGKSTADEIIKNLSIICNKKRYSITDIIRISYFTDSNKDIRYKGNADKNESSIKICPSLSVASEQISRFSDKEKIAVAIFDERILTRDLSNLDLFLNNDLNYSFVSTPISTDTSFDIIEHSENRCIFACTKSFILNNIVIGQTKNGEVGRINKQISAIVDKEIECRYISNEALTWDNVVEIKKTLKRIALNDYTSSEKDQFVVYAHSLLNYYLTSVFDNDFVDKLCQEAILSIESPSTKHNRLTELAAVLPEELHNEGRIVVDFLESLRLSYETTNPKRFALEDIIIENRESNILVLVPKAYYEPVIKSIESGLVSGKGSLTVTTYKKIDKSRFYDLIIVVGQFGDFDPELCLSTNKVISLLYEGERKIYDYKVREKRKKLNNLNNELAQTADYIMDIEDDNKEHEITRSVINTDSYIENNLSISVFESQLNKMLARESGLARPGQTTITVKYAASLEDGRRVLFTQFYKAYVYDEYTESINEKNVGELCPGDMVIFTSQKSATLDVVDDILSDNINSLSEASQRSYQQTVRWKQLLKEYITENNITVKELGVRLKKHGIKVESQTVRVWIDDYSHIICPQDPDSLRAIGDLLEDNDLQINYKEYFESGKTVKKIRANIRQVVRSVIFSKMTNTIANQTNGSGAFNVVEQYVADNYNSLFDIGILESIKEVDQAITSSSAINRPIELQEV